MLNNPGSESVLASIFLKKKLNILGIQETQLTGKFEKRIGSLLLINSGRDDNIHRQGVALLLDDCATDNFINYECINERILRARFKNRLVKLTVTVCYAPTESASAIEKDEFYDKLQDTFNDIPLHDVCILLGDLNTQVGKDDEGLWMNAIGRHGIGNQNDNGLRFATFCITNNLIIGGTMFEHNLSEKYTWLSPDSTTRNQIDHICISKHCKSSLHDVKSILDADIGSDYQLVKAKIKLKFKAKQKVHLLNYSTVINSLLIKKLQTIFNNQYKIP